MSPNKRAHCAVSIVPFIVLVKEPDLPSQHGRVALPHRSLDNAWERPSLHCPELGNQSTVQRVGRLGESCLVCTSCSTIFTNVVFSIVFLLNLAYATTLRLPASGTRFGRKAARFAERTLSHGKFCVHNPRMLMGFAHTHAPGDMSVSLLTEYASKCSSQYFPHLELPFERIFLRSHPWTPSLYWCS